MSFKVTVVTVTRNKVAIVIFKFTVWIYEATVTRNKVTIMSHIWKIKKLSIHESGSYEV